MITGRGVRGHRWAAVAFAVLTALCLATMPFAVVCCSRLTTANELELSAAIPEQIRDGFLTPFSARLLNWPAGFRILLMGTTACLFCLLAMLSLIGLRRMPLERLSVGFSRLARVALAIADTAILSAVVGVLYIFAMYAEGYLGDDGGGLLLWLLGIPLAVGLIQRPRWSGLLLGPPLAIGGWLSSAMLAFVLRIPLD